jgi:hypothetical protein
MAPNFRPEARKDQPSATLRISVLRLIARFSESGNRFTTTRHRPRAPVVAHRAEKIRPLLCRTGEAGRRFIVLYTLDACTRRHDVNPARSPRRRLAASRVIRSNVSGELLYHRTGRRDLRNCLHLPSTGRSRQNRRRPRHPASFKPHCFATQPCRPAEGTRRVGRMRAANEPRSCQRRPSPLVGIRGLAVTSATSPAFAPLVHD